METNFQKERRRGRKIIVRNEFMDKFYSRHSQPSYLFDLTLISCIQATQELTKNDAQIMPFNTFVFKFDYLIINYDKPTQIESLFNHILQMKLHSKFFN